MFGRPQRELSALMLMDMFSISRPQRELSALLLMDTDVQQTPTRVKCAHVDGYRCSADPNASSVRSC